MNTTTINKINAFINTMHTINKVDYKVEKARKYAIMAISGLLEDTKDYPNKEYKTSIMGYALQCYEAEVTKVYKKDKQVRVILKSDTLQMIYDEPINLLSSATILMILENMLR